MKTEYKYVQVGKRKWCSGTSINALNQNTDYKYV